MGSYDETECLIKSIVATFCDDKHFLERVKEKGVIDFGEAFQGHIRKGNITKQEYLEVKKKVMKRTYEL